MPCYNESEVFPTSLEQLRKILIELIDTKQIAPNSYLLFVDDGSTDNTWECIQSAVKNFPDFVYGLKLSRNCGHQSALLAGIQQVDTDISISIDADLQDDIQAIPQMVQAYQQGAEIVYGVRAERHTDTLFKRFSAKIFYKLMTLMGVEQIENHADFRLLGKQARAALLQYSEHNLYLRGIIPKLGFPSTQVYYKRISRQQGESKYPLKKMLSLALEGITSFTITPLRLISILGLLICLVTIFVTCYVLWAKFSGNVISGWTSVILAIFFFGGVQLLSLGVIGEYIGKIYLESKKRPKYFIEHSNLEEKYGDKNA
nr:glycosyltransferase family 2 protein [Rodentibacter haemolyticus]